MSKLEKLNKATALIQKYVPSIMELKEGCKVKLKSGKIRLLDMILNDKKSSSLYAISNGFYLRKDFEVYIDIHLEHVLKAINNANWQGGDVLVCDDGEIYVKDYEWGEFCYITDYDTMKPFKNQSEEFYNFLIKTLAD